MYALSVYPNATDLRRWDIRSGGALVRCGTSLTGLLAEMAVKDVVGM